MQRGDGGVGRLLQLRESGIAPDPRPFAQQLQEAAGLFTVKVTEIELNSPISAVLIAAANPLRWGLTIGLQQNTEGSIAPYPELTFDRGIRVYGNSVGPFFLSFREHGGLVSCDWYGIAIASWFTVVETLVLPGR